MYILQTIPPEELKNNPIIFGDFMQVEVPTSDRVYKEITNMTKLQNVLNQVNHFYFVNVFQVTTTWEKIMALALLEDVQIDFYLAVKKLIAFREIVNFSNTIFFLATQMNDETFL